MGIIPEYLLLNNTSTTHTHAQMQITAIVGNQTLLDLKVDIKKPIGPSEIPLLLFIISMIYRTLLKLYGRVSVSLYINSEE